MIDVNAIGHAMRELKQHHFDQRLLAGPQGGAAADRKPHGFAHLVLVAAGAEGAGRGVGRIGDEIVAVLFDRHPERPHERLSGELAIARRSEARQ